jgi:hypothetical protein
MTFSQPRLEPLGREWDRIGSGNPHDVETQRLGPGDEGALERLAV